MTCCSSTLNQGQEAQIPKTGAKTATTVGKVLIKGGKV